GEYTQLTGRAGRRGIDEIGYAIVLWSPFVPFDQVAALASKRTYALRSSFRPTYNMAANLVRRYTPDVAHHLLNLSFAQYGADRDERRCLTLAVRDFPARPRTIGRIDLPAPYMAGNRGFQREVAQAMGKVGTPDGPPSAREDRPRTRQDHRVAGMVQAVEDHPVTGCPDLRTHLRAIERVERLEKEVRRLERQVRSRTESLARQFDRVLRVLEAGGYVDGWSLTAAGPQLARIYHESDLLVAEGLRSELLDDPHPPAAPPRA